MGLAITGLNHVTLAVGDVQRSLAFYRDVLGCTVRAVWTGGAYLEAGNFWLCLSKDQHARSSPHPDYTHIAFSVSEDAYACLRERIMSEATIWRDDRSEGASTYFLDPDGHKLEIHLGSLATRLDHFRANPAKGVDVYNG